MDKLKTLKDIDSITLLFGADPCVVLIRDLREEAIKHIKSCTHEDIKLDEMRTLALCNSNHRCEKCVWIKYFFNITDKDLEVNK